MIFATSKVWILFLENIRSEYISECNRRGLVGSVLAYEM